MMFVFTTAHWEIQQLYCGPSRYELSDAQKTLIAAKGNPSYLSVLFNPDKISGGGA